MEELGDPRERARTVQVDRLAAAVWPERESGENCVRKRSLGDVWEKGKGGRKKKNVLDVTSTSGLVSANFHSSRSAMTDAAVCRHQGCDPNSLQSSSV